MTTAARPTVSVIVTAYNLERYVEATVASVLGQTVPAHEIIVVDDASTDRTAEILARFAEIRVITMPKNGGVLAATLAGLRAATGDVVAFLDGDDLWDRTKIERISAVFAGDTRVACVSHDYRFVDGEGRLVREDDPSQTTLRAYFASGDSDAIDDRMRRSILEYRGEVWLGSAWSIRRAALPLTLIDEWVAGLKDPERTYQDHPLATLLCLRSPGRFAYVDAKLLSYRTHASNHSGGFQATPERWARVVEKGRVTTEATLALVARWGDRAALERQKLHLAEFEFLAALTRRDWLVAARAYRQCAGALWTPKTALQELGRAGAMATLGAGRALRLKAAAGRAVTRVRAFRSVRA